MAAGPDETAIKRVLDRVREVDDREATPQVAAILDDVRATLRVPFVGSLFRLLAADPPLLEALWSTLGPALGTRYAEREADRLRAHALILLPHPDLGAEHRANLRRRGIDDRALAAITLANESVHYALPKLLLAAAAGAAALRGETVGGGSRRPEDALPLPRGPAPGSVALDPVPLEEIAPTLARRLEALRDAHGHPLLPVYYRVLARWPAYAERAAADLLAIVGTPRYIAASAALATLAEVAASGLPRPVGVEAEGSVLARDEAAALFSCYHERVLPDLILDVAFLRALLEGEGRARTNALSVTAA